MLELRDDAAGLAASVCPESGGELRSLRVRRGRRWFELLYAGGPAWRGGAPWLFPATGRTRPGGAFPMPIHGVALDRQWEAARVEPARVSCRLRSDERTRAVYPFGFTLTAEYELDGDGLLARAVVEAAASNAEEMPFSLGNHLTLALPLMGEGAAAETVVRTPAKEVLELDREGFLTGAARPAGCARGLSLGADGRLGDLVLSGFELGLAWVEVSGPGGLGLRLEWAQPPERETRLVLWSDGRSYFCPEPWLGEPDSLNTGRALERLAPGGRFSWELRLTPLPPTR